MRSNWRRRATLSRRQASRFASHLSARQDLNFLDIFLAKTEIGVMMFGNENFVQSRRARNESSRPKSTTRRAHSKRRQIFLFFCAQPIEKARFRKINASKCSAMGGEQHARYATKSHGAIAAKHRASEGETTVGSLTLSGPPAHLAATCALPTSTTATVVILSNVQDEPQSIRLATCLDRSAAASGAIASTVSPCLPWRKLLSADGAPGDGRAARRRAAHRAGASRRTGLSPARERSNPSAPPGFSRSLGGKAEVE